MQAKPVPQAVLDAAIRASAVESEQLNSERIAERFGSFGIDVVHDAHGQRLVSLYSGNDEERVCRTFAGVRRLATPTDRLQSEHAAIAAGRSIGATFRDSGWSVAKKTLFTGTVAADALIPQVARAMQVDARELLAIHAYQLVLDKARTTIDYATIVEAHHPDYLTHEALIGLFRVTSAADASIGDEAFAELLGHMGLAAGAPPPGQ